MHTAAVRPHIYERLRARRGRAHWFDTLDAKRSALIVIDMQSTFCEPGAPAEVAASRGIVEPINAFAAGLRKAGGKVIWVLHANTHSGGASDWELFFNNVVSDEVRLRTIESLAPGKQRVWKDLQVDESDITLTKNRYSALIPGASSLERVLRNLGIDTLLIAGTKTNVCCESTGRDAMMLDFKTVMLTDCCAALSDEEHQAALETFLQQFGDVMDGPEALRRMGAA